MSISKITIIGNVGRDPEMRYTPNGNAVTSFSVATNRRYNTQGGEQREETNWFRVSAWGKLAETCNTYVTKGMKVYVDGRFSTQEFTGQDGQTRTTLEVNANDVQFLDRPGSGEPGAEGGEAGGGGAGYASGDAGGSSPVEDLPW